MEDNRQEAVQFSEHAETLGELYGAERATHVAEHMDEAASLRATLVDISEALTAAMELLHLPIPVLDLAKKRLFVDRRFGADAAPQPPGVEQLRAEIANRSHLLRVVLEGVKDQIDSRREDVWLLKLAEELPEIRELAASRPGVPSSQISFMMPGKDDERTDIWYQQARTVVYSMLVSIGETFSITDEKLTDTIEFKGVPVDCAHDGNQCLVRINDALEFLIISLQRTDPGVAQDIGRSALFHHAEIGQLTTAEDSSEFLRMTVLLRLRAIKKILSQIVGAE